MNSIRLFILCSLLTIGACSDARHFSEKRVYQTVPDSCLGTPGCGQEITFRASGEAEMSFGDIVERGDYEINGVDLSVAIVGGISFSGNFVLSEDEEAMTQNANGVLWTRIE